MKKWSKMLALLLAIVMLFSACSRPGVSDPIDSNQGTTTTTGSDDMVNSDPPDDTLPDDDPWVDEEDSGNSDIWVDAEEDDGPVLFTKFEPADKAWAETLTPTFKWAKLPEGTVYTLQIFIYRDDGYRKVREITGITTDSYTLKESEKLQENELYRWKLIAVYDGIRYAADNGSGGLFVAKFNAKTHPANVGVDYAFQDKVSEEVLNNYLDRVLSIDYSEEYDMWQENLRVILYTGAKYISRANMESVWKVGEQELLTHEKQKEVIAKAHEYDPELVFEGGIFEKVSRGVENYHIPAYVFEDLGYEVEDRNFVFEDMINITDPSLDGYGLFGSEDTGVPDITRKEAQLWIYYRGTSFIDLGMEALHMGIVGYVAREDTKNGYANYAKVLNAIRAYAKEHARRGFVFINGHTHGFLQPDGKTLMFDFHAWTLCPISPRDEVAHKPTDDNPQRLILQPNPPSIIYQHSFPTDGNTYLTPSGWEITNGLPYTVEHDNAGGNHTMLNQPTYSWNTGLVWGLDEMGWFKIQPKNYRTYWLQYITDTVRSFDEDGHVMMPGSRGCTTTTMAASQYRCNNPEWGYYHEGSDDEESIRNVFIRRNSVSNE